MAYHKLSVEDRFWSKVKRTSSCWLWTAHKDKRGYGRLTINRTAVFAHRVSYEWAKGPIPDGLIVLHDCDTPSCVNPAHLRAGTHQENNADMFRKGRAPVRKGRPKKKERQRVIVVHITHTILGGTIHTKAWQTEHFVHLEP